MIHYALICAEDHEFDAWFRSADDFDTQAARGLVTCAVCGTTSVSRALMAPNVVTARSRRGAPAGVNEPTTSIPASDAPSETLPMAVAPDPQQRAALEALSELKRKITAQADYVGERFAEEARKMHYGEVTTRGIYGEATGEEARALIEEGIEVHPLPILPDDRN